VTDARSAWGRPEGWLVALLAGAVALRAYRLDRAPAPNRARVAEAWGLVHGGAKPHHALAWLLAPSQVWQGAPSYADARIAMLVLAAAGLAAAWWLGRAAYGTAAGFVAAGAVAVDTAHVAASREVVAAVPLAALVAVALALLAAGRIELAGAAAGLAAAVDYPGWLLLVPLVAVGWGAWRRVAVGVVLAAVLSAPAWLALDDRFGGGGRGWPALVWHSLGPVLALSALGFAGALVARGRADVALASFVAAYGLYLVALPDDRARYTLPLVPALGALAGRFRSLAAVALLLLVVPLTWSIREARRPPAKTASTMVRGEDRTPRRGPPGGARAARLRLRERPARGERGP
jgi:hypothetical protein